MYRKIALFVAFCFVTAAAINCQQTKTPEPTKPASQPLIFADPAAPPLGEPEDENQPSAAPQAEVRKEDWTVLPVDKSGLNLALFGGPVLEKWEEPEYTRELIRVEWRYGDPMDIYVIRPHGAVKPATILYLYDYLSDTERFQDDGWCKRVTKGGFAAVGMVSAVTGHRVHAPRPMRQWFVSELQESLAASAHDVQMTLNYLASRGDLDVSKVGMFGDSSGAAIAVLAAAADPRITVLDLMEPWGDWPLWLKDSPIVPDAERDKYVKADFLAKVANLDPVVYLPQLKTRTVRIEFVGDDTRTPKSAEDAILAAAPKGVDVVLYKDATEHYKTWKVSGLSGWIESQLQKQLPPKANPAATTVASRLP